MINGNLSNSGTWVLTIFLFFPSYFVDAKSGCASFYCVVFLIFGIHREVVYNIWIFHPEKWKCPEPGDSQERRKKDKIFLLTVTF